MSTCNHINFNAKCKKLKVFPNYINVWCSDINPRSKKAVQKAKITWLNEEIKHHYKTRDNISAHLKVFHSQLNVLLHPLEFELFYQKCHEKARQLSYLQYQKQKKKLAQLFWSSSSEKTTTEPEKPFHARVINFSTVAFSRDEEELLHHGLNFAPTMRVKPSHILNLAVHADMAFEDDDLEVKSNCSSLIRSGIKYINNSRTCDRLIKEIKEKLDRNNLILSKADKGNSITILEKSSYLQKMTECLNSMNLTEIMYDPTDKFSRVVKETINSSDKIFDRKEMFLLKDGHPSIPLVYGLPKIHKVGVPVRPVSASFNAPTQKLCKKLNKLLPDLINFDPKYSIKNTKDLVNKIKDLQLPKNAKLVSFDVCNLFPSVPVNKLKEILWDTIKTKISDKSQSTQLINLINVCIDQNYFMFDNKMYLQKDGLAMGSALSPFLAEFFMNHLENVLFKCDNSLINHILTWVRYVDDVFCIWTGTERQLNNFLNNILNKLDNNIKFTVELGNKSINFLDLTITLNNENLDFNIYRKDTYSDAIIPRSSLHPWNIKMSSFHSMLDRLLEIPLSQTNFKKELETIKLIAKNNGYSNRTIYKLLTQKQYKKAINQIFPSRQPNAEHDIMKWRKIPYLGELSKNLNKLFKEKNIKPAFFNNMTLKSILVNNKLKPKINKIDKCGVYRLNCADCDAVYIGQTKRSLRIRYKEHINNTKSSNPNSGFSKHLSMTGHKPNPDNIELLHYLSDKKLLNRYETFEIKKARDDGYFLVNDQLDFKNNSPLLNSCLLKYTSVGSS